MFRCNQCRQAIDPATGDCACSPTTQLGDLARRTGTSSADAPAPLPDRRDFFISFYARHHADKAQRIYEIIRELGRTAYLFDNEGGSGHVHQQLNHALRHADRLICLASPGYFNSPVCRAELQYFFDVPGPDRIVFFEAKPCDIEPLYTGLYRNPLLIEPSDPAFATTVRRVLTRSLAAPAPKVPTVQPVHHPPPGKWTEAQFRAYEARTGHQRTHLEFRKPEEHPDDPHPIAPEPDQPEPLVAKGPARSALAAAASLLVLAASPFLHYGWAGPAGVWDARESAAYNTLKRDISLPRHWTFANVNLREYITATDPEALTRWSLPTGAQSLFERRDQALHPIDTAILKATAQNDIATGIAQFRTVFSGQTITLLADVRDQGQSYRGFRLSSNRNGSFRIAQVSKRRGDLKETLQAVERPFFTSPADTMHDLGISKERGLLSLYRNRQVLANWQVPEQISGAFGLAVDQASDILLFRWSVAATRQESPLLMGLYLHPPHQWTPNALSTSN